VLGGDAGCRYHYCSDFFHVNDVMISSVRTRPAYASSSPRADTLVDGDEVTKPATHLSVDKAVSCQFDRGEAALAERDSVHRISPDALDLLAHSVVVLCSRRRRRRRRGRTTDGGGRLAATSLARNAQHGDREDRRRCRRRQHPAPPGRAAGRDAPHRHRDRRILATASEDARPSAADSRAAR